MNGDDDSFDTSIVEKLRWLGLCTGFSAYYFEPSVMWFPESIPVQAMMIDGVFGFYFYQLTFKKVKNINWLWLAGLGSFWLFVLSDKLKEREISIEFTNAIKTLSIIKPNITEE